MVGFHLVGKVSCGISQGFGSLQPAWESLEAHAEGLQLLVPSFGISKLHNQWDLRGPQTSLAIVGFHCILSLTPPLVLDKPATCRKGDMF